VTASVRAAQWAPGDVVPPLTGPAAQLAAEAAVDNLTLPSAGQAHHHRTRGSCSLVAALSLSGGLGSQGFSVSMHNGLRVTAALQQAVV